MKTRFDIQYVRNQPADFDARLGMRGVEPSSEIILGLDERRRGHLHASEEARAEAKRLQKEIGQRKKQALDASDLIDKAGRLNAGADGAAKMAADAEQRLEAVVCQLPNLPLPGVPRGFDETSNVEEYTWGTPSTGIGRTHEEMNFDFGFITAANMSGSRFSMLRGPLARLHRAIGQFMLDLQVRRGYEEVIPPLLVRPHAMFGTGQLPKFEADLFKTAESDKELDQFYLIPTAEVSLTNIMHEALDSPGGPKRFVALTPCFRAEAGAAGRDSRGMIRQHQFEKVELVSVCTAEQWLTEHDYMVKSAEAVLKELGLPYRRMLLCTGDMGFSAQKTYDLEVWMPGQNQYREISSISYCGEFQARRMNARYRTTEGTRFYHTLNGSGLAVGRTLAALVENYAVDENSIAIPSALQSYLGGTGVLYNGE